MAKTWAEEMHFALGLLRGRFKVKDPDVIASTLSRYWYELNIMRRVGCTQQVRWALLAELAGDPFPGTGTMQGRASVHRMMARRPLYSLGDKRFPRPDHVPIVRDEARWVEDKIKTEDERAAVAHVKAGDNLSAAARRKGLDSHHYHTHLKYLAHRCRKLRQ